MSDDPTRLRDATTASPLLRTLLRASVPGDPSDDARARVAERLARDVTPAREETPSRKTG